MLSRKRSSDCWKDPEVKWIRAYCFPEPAIREFVGLHVAGTFITFWMGAIIARVFAVQEPVAAASPIELHSGIVGIC